MATNLHRTVEQYKAQPWEPWSDDDVIELGEHVPVLLPFDDPDDDPLIDLDPTAPLPPVEPWGDDELVPLD